MNTKEVKYHNSCRLKYQKEAEALGEREKFKDHEDKLIWQKKRGIPQCLRKS